MPVEGFDDASKSISKRGSARRKASRDAYSKNLQEKAKNKDAEKAAKKAKQSEFNKYATPGQKRKAARNSSVNKDDVIAKGKLAEAAKQAKAKKKELDYFAGESDKAVKRDADKKAAKAKADGNITKTVTPKTKAKDVAPKAKPASTKTTTTKPPAKTKLVNAPGAYTKPSEFKKSVSTFTSAADRLRAKGVGSLKPTPPKTKKGSYNFTEGTGPNTSVFDKTKNVAPKTEKKTKVKAKKRAAKGSKAATLKKGFGY